MGVGNRAGKTIKEPGGKGAGQMLFADDGLLGSQKGERGREQIGRGTQKNSHNSDLNLLVFLLDVLHTKPKLTITSL